MNPQDNKQDIESGMVWIPGGTFLMGSDNHYPEEAPARRVHVDGFWMDAKPVTNTDFKKFVEETGYVTFCEKPPDPKQYPGALPEMLKPSSVVFVQPLQPVSLKNPYQWWNFIAGASWKQPRGPGSSIEGLENHPVVHVAYPDIQAYLAWSGKELPTEAEWEFAARGGLDGKEFAWGDELAPEGKHLANTWQGEFPWQSLCEDGFHGLSPVDAFPANAYGLYDMIGNAWEWTDDWYVTRDPSVKPKACCIPKNPRGGREDESYGPRDSVRIPRKVMKGGSHLCAPNYCRRYRPAARMAQPIDTSTNHLSFRCIKRVKNSGEHGRVL